jgi:hypothetical protein
MGLRQTKKLLHSKGKKSTETTYKMEETLAVVHQTKGYSLDYHILELKKLNIKRTSNPTKK